MGDAICLVFLIIVILMVTITVTLFAKLIGILVAPPGQDLVTHIVSRKERLATIGATLDFKHE